MKEENDLFKKVLTDDFLKEKPSADFTKNVMSQVEQIINEPKKIQPLVSKKVWYKIFTISLIIIVGSFILETIEPVRQYNEWWVAIKSIDLSTYKMTFKLFIGLSLLMITLSASDIIYRKLKHLS